MEILQKNKCTGAEEWTKARSIYEDLWPWAIENLSIPLKVKITAYTTGTGVTCNVIKPVDKWCAYHSLYYQIASSNL